MKIIFIVCFALSMITSSCSNNHHSKNLRKLVKPDFYNGIILDTVFVARFENEKLANFLSMDNFNCEKVIQNDSITEIHIYPRTTEISSNDYKKIDVILINNKILPVINDEEMVLKKGIKLQSGGGCIITFKQNSLYNFVFLQ